MAIKISGVAVKICFEAISAKTLRISLLPERESVGDIFSVYDLAERDVGKGFGGNAGEDVGEGIGEVAAAENDAASLTCTGEFNRAIGLFDVSVDVNPLAVNVNYRGKPLQTLVFDENSGDVGFPLGDGPLYGLGHGYATGLDRRGYEYDLRVNGQVRGIIENFSATSPTPYIIGADGWALYFHQPWKGKLDLRGSVGRGSDGERSSGGGCGSDVERSSGGGCSSGGGRGVFRKYPSAYCDVFAVACDEPLDAPREYYRITGLHPMLPKYAFGYIQSYRTLVHGGRNYVLETARWLREHEIPCDALIYLGTGYCDYGWNTYNGDFKFHPDVFPDPERTMRELHDMHYKIGLHVTRCFTGLHGRVGDGDVSPLEYDHCKNYWKRHVEEIYSVAKNEIWWPDDADEVDMEQRLNRHRMYYEGSLRLNPDARPFQMQRNTFPGANKWGGVIWTGDVNAEWETLKNQIHVGLNAGLSCSAYWGTDTGGFFSTSEFDMELFVRWAEFSAFTPFFRCHGRPSFLHNPWGWEMFGDLDGIPPESSPGVRNAGPPSAILPDARVAPLFKKIVNLRYELLPTVYNLAYEATLGLPMMRPLWCYWPGDATARAMDSEYMFGENLLVAPVTEKGAVSRSVWLPEGGWYNYWTREYISGGKTVEVSAPLGEIPLFVRAGGFIAKAPVVQYVNACADPDSDMGNGVFGPLTVEVYAGADGDFRLYEDDGVSMAYQRGGYFTTGFHWNDAGRALNICGAIGGTAIEKVATDESAARGTATVGITSVGTDIQVESRTIGVRVISHDNDNKKYVSEKQYEVKYAKNCGKRY